MDELNELMELPEVIAEPVIIDFESLKNRLAVTLKDYEGIEVTEDTLPMAKKKQKEMAGMRTQLEEFRKKVKRLYTEPLELFETQMKSLVSMVKEAEEPIASDIKGFDDKRRAEKRETAERIIKEVSEEYELLPKFSAKIEMKKMYTNLTARESVVREDIENQAMVLKKQQDDEESVKESIRSAVDKVNESITAKLNPESYLSLIGRMESAEIITRIMERAEEIRKSESEPISEPKTYELEELVREPIKPSQNARQVSNNGTSGKLYKVIFAITGTEAQQKTLSKFLKSNHYTYEVESQIELN